MIDKTTYDRVAQLEKLAPTLLTEFNYLLRAKEVAQHWSARKFGTLEVTQIGPYSINATYLNTTVRFQLYLGYKDNNVNGRVVCWNMYSVCDEPHHDLLGEFNFDQSGRAADMGADERGNIRIMSGHADEIVATWLNKAIEQGPQSLAQTRI